MINSIDTITYTKPGFDGKKYIKMQKEKIIERIHKFSGRLYLEIGGKFMFDSHASRVLPGFDPESKRKIFSNLKDQAEILFCANANDFISDRQLSNENISYDTYILDMIKDINKKIGLKPHVVINMIDKGNTSKSVDVFEKKLKKMGYNVYKRYKIKGYPAVKNTLSKTGYGQDDYIKVKKNLILVTGAASNSGKMSTCLGQIYLEHQKGIESGYAKYETFPIWNLALNHPVNIAYEAATADIGDYNCIDTYHKKVYGKKSVNYNRDVKAFEIVMKIAKKIVQKNNFMTNYKSPTDMGISTAGFCILDDKVVSLASLEEIRRRRERYKQMIRRGEGEEKRVKICNKLEKKSIAYCKKRKYL